MFSNSHALRRTVRMAVAQSVHIELCRTIYTAQMHAWRPIHYYILRLFKCQQSVAYSLDWEIYSNVWIIWKFISALFSTCHMGILIYCTKLYQFLLATEEFSEKMQLLTFSCRLFLCVCISLLMLFFALGHGCWKVVQDMAAVMKFSENSDNGPMNLCRHRWSLERNGYLPKREKSKCMSLLWHLCPWC